MNDMRDIRFTFSRSQLRDLLDHLAEKHSLGLVDESTTYEEATRWHLDLHALAVKLK